MPSVFNVAPPLAIIIAISISLAAIAFFFGGAALTKWFDEYTDRTGSGVFIVYVFSTVMTLGYVIYYANTYLFTFEEFLGGFVIGLVSIIVTSFTCIVLYVSLKDVHAALTTLTTSPPNN